MGFYDPPFGAIFLLLLGLIYIPVAIYTISRFKLNEIGYLLAAASFASYLLVGAYMAGAVIMQMSTPKDYSASLVS